MSCVLALSIVPGRSAADIAKELQEQTLTCPVRFEVEKVAHLTGPWWELLITYHGGLTDIYAHFESCRIVSDITLKTKSEFGVVTSATKM